MKSHVFTELYYASVGGATRHTVVRWFVIHQVFVLLHRVLHARIVNAPCISSKVLAVIFVFTMYSLNTGNMSFSSKKVYLYGS